MGQGEYPPGWFKATPDKRPDVEAIEARAMAATKGPWIEGQPGNFRVYGPANMGRQSGPLLEIQILGVSDPEIEGANRAFVAHARQDIPALIAWVEKLEAVVEAARGRDKYHPLSSGEARIIAALADLDGGGDG